MTWSGARVALLMGAVFLEPQPGEPTQEAPEQDNIFYIHPNAKDAKIHQLLQTKLYSVRFLHSGTVPLSYHLKLGG